MYTLITLVLSSDLKLDLIGARCATLIMTALPLNLLKLNDGIGLRRVNVELFFLVFLLVFFCPGLI